MCGARGHACCVVRTVSGAQYGLPQRDVTKTTPPPANGLHVTSPPHYTLSALYVFTGKLCVHQGGLHVTIATAAAVATTSTTTTAMAWRVTGDNC
ncbi:hypothetical protein E2C01_045269 [Portunus trituberculatus]|uniref:Uncharacterized protein n=1 Tax=Portunus trituberculatus TaxID=210409 RepID=A0A5B7G4K9_PORTR|nr:hypothetical protein [Portunus trituberculatus]